MFLREKAHKGGRTMSIERVRQEFEKENIADRIIETEQSSATVELAAAALGCEPERIAKTLSFYGPDEKTILVVAAGDAKIHSGKFKRTFGLKCTMLKGEDVEERTGHRIGGVCPFALKEGVDVYLDESLRRFSSVYPACGSSNSAIELTLDELERYSHAAGWADVCKTA